MGTSVSGVEGYIAHDKSIEELLKDLETYIPTENQVEAQRAPIYSQDLPRERQVTGERASPAINEEERNNKMINGVLIQRKTE